MKCARWIMVHLLLVVLCSCTGETGSKTVVDGDPQAAGDGGGASSCSTGGIAASCDPLTGGGCGSAGSCYLVKNQGPSCVCPAASAGDGAACNTTTECAPGLVCAGSAAPGTCRKVCDPVASDCLNGDFCRAITAFPSHGYCDSTGS